MTERFVPGPGSDFGSYHVGRQLGRGGMGIVYEATHRGLERQVALKFLPPEMADDASYRERFLREARTLARLDSPHIVAIHDAGELDGWLYLAMQLVRDGDLGQRLAADGPLMPLRALHVVRQLAIGLDAAHGAGVLHRDIKPSNVLLRVLPDGTLHGYLCDFGIAAAGVSDQTRTGTVVGTWAYLAPERHHGLPASTASDLYALGCVLWATLTGRPPYSGTDMEVALAHVNAPVPQLAVRGPLDAELNTVLRSLLAKDPAQRPSSAAVLRLELEAVVARISRGGGAGGWSPSYDPDPATILGPAVAPGGSVPTAAPTAGPTAAADRWSPVPVPGSGQHPTHVGQQHAYGGQGAPYPAFAQQPGRPGAPRRKGLVWGAAALGAAVLVGGTIVGVSLMGGDGDDDPTDDTTTSAGPDGELGSLAGLSAEEIFDEATAATASASSLRLVGDFADGGQSVGVDLFLGTDGCEGTMALNGDTVDLMGVDGTYWFRAGQEFWEAQSSGGLDDLAIGLLVDKWVLDTSGDFAEFCNIESFLGDDDGRPTDFETGETRRVGGQEAVQISYTTSDGTETVASVAVAEPHYFLRADQGATSTADLTDFDEPFDPEPPPEDEVVDPENVF